LERIESLNNGGFLVMTLKPVSQTPSVTTNIWVATIYFSIGLCLQTHIAFLEKTAEYCGSSDEVMWNASLSAELLGQITNGKKD
jgi:hypothetical protein